MLLRQARGIKELEQRLQHIASYQYEFPKKHKSKEKAKSVQTKSSTMTNRTLKTVDRITQTQQKPGVKPGAPG